MTPSRFIARRTVIALALAVATSPAWSQQDSPGLPAPPPAVMRPRSSNLVPAEAPAAPVTNAPSVTAPVTPRSPPVAPASRTTALPIPTLPAPQTPSSRGAAAGAAAPIPAAGSNEAEATDPGSDSPDSSVTLQPGERLVTPSAESETDRAVPIRFTEAPLDMVLRDYANLTGRTMIMAPGVTATITLESQSALTEPERRMAIEAALAMNNISLVPLGEKFFKVVPSANVRQEGLAVSTGDAEAAALPEGESISSQVIMLKHLSLEEATAVLQGLLHGFGKIQALERTNSMLITDTQTNLKRVLEVLAYLDRPSLIRTETRVYELRHAEAASVASQINDLIADAQGGETASRRSPSSTPTPSSPSGVIRPSPRGAAAPATPSTAPVEISAAERGVVSGEVKILSDERTNTLIVLSDPVNFEFFDKIIAVLDREVEPEMVVKVHPLEYADAEEASQMLNDFIGAANASRRTSTTGTTTGSGAGTSRTDTSRTRTTTGTAAAATDARSQSLRDFIDRIERPTTGGAADSTPTKFGQISPNTRILADTRSNSILLMGRRGDVEALIEIVRQIDVMLAQVIIEAVIVEVTLSDNISYGFDWLQRSLTAYESQNTGPLGGVTSNQPIASWGGGLVTGESAAFMDAATVARDTALSGGSLTYFLTLNNLNLDGILRMAASSSDAKVLSTPVIMTTDNTEATIIAGEERPVVGVTTVTDGGNRSSSYEYRNIGIELAVKPRINPARVVVMEVKQTADNVGDIVQIDGNEVPVITKRELQAFLTVSNRTTVVLGGLVSNTDRKTQTKVPFVGDIPIIGRLFRSQSTQKQRTELLVFLTPYVITTPGEARDETRRLHDSVHARESKWHHLWNDSDLGREMRQQDAEGIPLRARSRRTAAPVSPDVPTLMDREAVKPDTE
ncbi:MAG: type II secretion system secretin GspD [Kiritimatiellae bacterium]|nr:type II secretion system secretin GspD [Kiritimatiellia bacterium]